MVVRYKIPGDPISITYGCDMEYGIKIFLAVYDSRLECDERTSKDVRKVLEQIGDRDCEGSYFNVRTGPIGYGQRVSKKAMEAFMRRFGVPEKHIAELMESEPCFVCNESTTKTCGKCKAAFYCSATCQKADWKCHKIFCGAQPFPDKAIGERSVQAVLLPTDSEEPMLVRVPLVGMTGDDFDVENDNQHAHLDISQFLQGEIRTRMACVGKSNAVMSDYFQISWLNNQKATTWLPLNDCLTDLLQTARPDLAHISIGVPGPVLITKLKTMLPQIELDPQPLKVDVDPEDLSKIVRLLVVEFLPGSGLKSF